MIDAYQVNQFPASSILANVSKLTATGYTSDYCRTVDLRVYESNITFEKITMRSIVVSVVVLILFLDQPSTAVPNGSEDGSRLSSGTDIVFESPDLITLVETTSGLFHLEAYKSVNNDQILRNVSSGQPTARTSQLFWVSVGQPEFVKMPDSHDPNVAALFHSSATGFSTYIQMLTPAHRSVLASTARTKYGVDVNNSQIVDLVLSKFECSLVMFDIIGNKHLLRGEVADFRHFPLRMDFQVPPSSTSRKLFLKLLETNSNLEFSCEMATAGTMAKTNTLVITTRQQKLIGLEEKLFGELSDNSPNRAYVTRDQMTNLAREMYSTLNIVEDFRMTEVQFIESFIEDLVDQAASNQFSQISVDVVLSSLSRYGFAANEYVNPFIMKRELGSILTIGKVNDQNRIALNETHFKNFSESNTGSGGRNAIYFGIRASADWARDNSKNEANITHGLIDQLGELNSLLERHIQWELTDGQVRPQEYFGCSF